MLKATTSSYVSKWETERRLEAALVKLERLEAVCFAGGITGQHLRFLYESTDDVLPALRAAGAM